MKVYSEEILALRDRIKDGNAKLNLAWGQIRQIDHESREWSDAVEKWHVANEKLSALCSHLKLLGYRDCLYLDTAGKKTMKCSDMGELGCRVCPSEIEYWVNEIEWR